MCLQRLEYDDNLAVATSRLHMKTLSSIQESIYCFDRSQNVYDYSSVFMIRYKFPHKSQFINVFDKILTSGLIAKWENDLQERPSVTMQTSDELHVYSLADLAAIVIYLSLIIVLSIVVFIAEFIIHYKRHTNRFWNLLDKFICGKRHYFTLEPQQQT